MEFWYKRRKHLLRGSGSQVLTPSAEKLTKHSRNQSQLCMIQVIPQGSDEDKWHPLEVAADKDLEEDPALLAVLSEFLHYLKNLLVYHLLEVYLIIGLCCILELNL